MALDDSDIRDLYQSGLSCADIAGIDQRSEGTIYNRLREMGVDMRSRSEANKKFSDRAVIALYNLGLSCSQIGRLFGVHSTTVVKRLQRLDFPLRPNDTAAAVGFSEEEFKTHFCKAEFTDRLAELS